MIIYVLSDRILWTLKQDWGYIYGSLKKGSYTLVKTTFKESDTPIIEKDKNYISVDFEIK